MIGITDGRKDMDFNQVMTCAACVAMGSFRVFHDSVGKVLSML